jgi:hypothetical protein
MTTITAFIPYLTKGDFLPTELKEKDILLAKFCRIKKIRFYISLVNGERISKKMKMEYSNAHIVHMIRDFRKQGFLTTKKYGRLIIIKFTPFGEELGKLLREFYWKI